MSLTEKQLANIKTQLQAERNRIVEELKRFSKQDVHNKEHFNPTFPDMTDQIEESAGEVSQFVEELAIEGDLEKSLIAIDSALESIDNKTYGACAVCKKPIDPKRLEANSSATTCIEHTK